MPAPALTSRELFRDVWRLAWPIAGTNFLLRGTAIVDTAFVGRLSATALAGLGIAQVPLFLSMAVMRGLGIGAQVLIAYHTGAKEPERRLKVARAVVVLSTVVALLIAVFLWFISPSLCRLIGADEPMLAESMRFLYVYYILFIFSGLFFVFSAIFQGAGDARTPLYTTLGVNVIHVVVSYATIFGHLGSPKLGVVGAALGLGVSELAGTVVLAILAVRRGLWQPSFRGLSLGATRAVWRIGAPTVGERLLVNGMQGAYYRLLTGFGTAAIAAHRIGIDMEAVAFLPALGFGQAGTTLVGQHLGANDPVSARRAGWITTWIAVAFMGTLGLTYYFFAEQWMRLFTNDPEVIALGIRFCRVAAFIQVPLAFALVLAGALRGAGETRWVMAIPFLGGWMIRIPLGYLFGYVLGFGLMGVWWMMLVDWIVRGVVITVKFSFMKFRLGEKVRIPPKPPPVVPTRELGS
ncbi:MAG TPA: MATE family efflux transporter [Acidobacteriota bacterium]|nr:MATE family efflux transporter [Acidobacteriota bacterium]